MTSSPLTTTPVRGGVDRPADARRRGRRARPRCRRGSTWSLLTTRLVLALPTCGPPMRKNTSCTAVGFAWRSSRVAPCLLARCRAASSAGEFFGAGVDGQPGDVDAGDVGDLDRRRAAVRRSRVASPRPSTTVSARVARAGVRSIVVDAGREQQVLALGELPVDLLGASPTASRRRSRDSGSDAPGRRPVGPGRCRRLFVCAAGRRPVRSPRRVDVEVRLLLARPGWWRASCTAGWRSAARRTAPGAPSTPEKIWFQTPFDQLPSCELRVSHCCCEPLITSPSRASAMKPPLAYWDRRVQ